LVLAHFWWFGRLAAPLLTIPPVCDAILLNVLFPPLTAVRTPIPNSKRRHFKPETRRP
jgi:hypothetical protein